MIRSTDEIYNVLDSVLSSATSPKTCVELMDIPEVRAAALSKWGKDVQEASENLSDTLGFMWRRGVVDRFTAPVSNRSRARWAYASKNKFQDYDNPIPYIAPVRTKNRCDLEIVEKDGEVILNFEKFTVVIRPK